MTPKAKHTGRVLETMIVPVLTANGYEVQTQVFIGEKIGGGKHQVDVLAKSPKGEEIPISLKWQQTGGTVQEKIPFEVIKLLHALQNSKGRFIHAYMVLGGEGMDEGLKKFYLNDGLADHIKDAHLVKILSLDQFIALANKQAL